MSCDGLAGESCDQTAGRTAYADVVFEFYAPRRVQLDFLEGLSDDIVGLVLALLSGLDGRGFVEVALVVNVEALEGVGQGEDFVLGKLRKLPAEPSASSRGHCRGIWEPRTSAT